MTDKEINTNKYFVELTDIGGGTIGYTVPFPEELLREIIKQNKQLKRKEQECEELKRKVEDYKKAFEEIEEIVKDWYKNEWSCYKCRINMDKKLKNILDIINKAKGGNDER